MWLSDCRGHPRRGALCVSELGAQVLEICFGYWLPDGVAPDDCDVKRGGIWRGRKVPGPGEVQAHRCQNVRQQSAAERSSRHRRIGSTYNGEVSPSR